MIKRLLILSVAFLFVAVSTFAQGDNQEGIVKLKEQRTAKEAEIAALNAEIAEINKKILEFPGWSFGSFGLIGANFSSYNNWLFRGNEANNALSNINISANGYANNNQEKYFWRNSIGVNIGLAGTGNDLGEANDNIAKAIDNLVITSLFGYKLTEKFALSALGEYRSSILDNFNDPGYLDLGIGGTWTPITDLVVVIHPLNYNFVFASDDVAYTSSLGCKIVADYTRSLPILNGISWKSNFSAFLSYKDMNNLSNWTWINGFSFAAWKGIGVGVEFGLRGSMQEFLGSLRTPVQAIVDADPTNTANQALLDGISFDTAGDLSNNTDYDFLFNSPTDPTTPGLGLETSNPLQSYFTIGLSYSIQ